MITPVVCGFDVDRRQLRVGEGRREEPSTLTENQRVNRQQVLVDELRTAAAR
jgi:hypothetical protein